MLGKGEGAFVLQNQRVLYQFAVSRLNQRELLVCAGQGFRMWRREQPSGYSRSAVAVCPAAAQLPLPVTA